MIGKQIAATLPVLVLLLALPVAAETGINLKNNVLSSSQIMRISGEAGLQNDGYYAGELYNGNHDIFITEIAVYVRTTRQGEVFPRLYSCKVHIPPLSTIPFGFDIIVGDEGSDYTWGIFEAKGYTVDAMMTSRAANQ